MFYLRQCYKYWDTNNIISFIYVSFYLSNMNQFYIGQIKDRLKDVATENRFRHNWYILSLLNHTLWITSMANILSRLNTLITFHRKKEKIAFLSLPWMQFVICCVYYQYIWSIITTTKCKLVKAIFHTPSKYSLVFGSVDCSFLSLPNLLIPI